MRYALKRKDGSIVEGIGWNKKAHAEHWIQEHCSIFGGLDWRVGGLFKAKNDDQLEVVWSKSLKSVNWLNVDPENPNV
jgi:hypothetical protein